jgi:hypothetical protein
MLHIVYSYLATTILIPWDLTKLKAGNEFKKNSFTND